MGRFLAVDYGEKRVGLAVSDPSGIIATKLDVVDTPEIFAFLKAYTEKEDVELFVLGNPKQMNNTPSQSADAVLLFAEKLSQLFPEKKIYMTDERFTSKMASHVISQSGMDRKKRQNKGLIDTVAAVLILQDFMKMYGQGLITDKFEYNNKKVK